MCVFCAVATQASGPTESFETFKFVESISLTVGVFLWLCILYQGYQRSKREINSSDGYRLIRPSWHLAGFAKFHS